MAKKNLQVRYTGDLAENYDATRRNSRRYANEEAAFAGFAKRLNAQSVLDCPFGTGRWVEYYRAMTGKVVAVDLSADMLAVAKSKLDTSPDVDVDYVVGSIFDVNFSAYASKNIDLVVCTRFLNWVPAGQAVKAIANLSAVRSKHAIFGCSVRPSSLSLIDRIKMWFRLRRENSERQRSDNERKAQQYVHDEGLILKAFAANGWKTVEKKEIFSSGTRQNYFWLLEKA